MLKSPVSGDEFRNNYVGTPRSLVASVLHHSSVLPWTATGDCHVDPQLTRPASSRLIRSFAPLPPPPVHGLSSLYQRRLIDSSRRSVEVEE